MYRLETADFIFELSPNQYQKDLLYPDALQIRVASYGFTAVAFMDADDLYLADFAVCLNELYETLQGSAKLEDPWHTDSFVEFSAAGQGHIKVIGMLRIEQVHGFKQELNFENEIDQTVLRDFAKALFRDYGKYAE